jgi:hypothetical protein
MSAHVSANNLNPNGRHTPTNGGIDPNQEKNGALKEVQRADKMRVLA